MSTVAPAGLGASPLLPRARMAQVLTIAWLVVELLLAMTAGLMARSVALTAFGADTAVELITAAVVLSQLMAQRLDDEGSFGPAARRASRVAGVGLYLVAAYIVVSSTYALVTGVHPAGTMFGVVVALLSIVVMFALWRWRLRLSEDLHSAALRADAACSAVCFYMGLTLLAGLVVNRAFGWWWADPVAGLAMIWWIRREANEALEAARTGHHCDTC
ncbi:MAG: cation transporter [Candidatus Dormibacteria bacterium]